MSDTDKDVEVSLQDAIRQSMEEHTETADDKLPEDEGTPPVKEEPARDEQGKFVAKEKETEVEAAARLEPDKKEPPATAPAATEQPILTQDKAPQGWSPLMREKWATIPEDVRKEVLRREEDAVKGVRQLQEKYAPMERFVTPLMPFIEEAHKSGVAPEAYISTVLNSERVLRTADLPGKFQEILRIADQYGVPLRDVINQSVGMEVIGKAAPSNQGIPPQFQQELNDLRQRLEQREDASYTAQVEAFAASHEFFQDVKEQMAALIESGAYKDLDSAYDAAIWANAGVREVLLGRQGATDKKKELEDKQKTASGASIKPKGTIDPKTDDEEDDDIAATVRKAYIASETQRV